MSFALDRLAVYPEYKFYVPNAPVYYSGKYTKQKGWSGG